MSRTLVLCGSLGASAAAWDSQLESVAAFEVVIVEHPGHGTTPLYDVAMIDDLAQHVLGTVTAGPFSFVGLSLGGAVGLRLALDHGDRLEKLVLSCTLPRFGEPAQWRERAETVRRAGTQAIADAVLARWFTPSFKEVDRWREILISTDREGYARCCDALAEWDVRGRLATITTPTLVLAGADDPSAPPPEVSAMADEIPGARFATIDAARHLPNVERPTEFNRLLEDHL
jgi:3-oxoadipate enol-lactonase